MWKSVSKDKTEFKLRGKTYTISHYDAHDGKGTIHTKFQINNNGSYSDIDPSTLMELLYMVNKRSVLEEQIQTLEAQMLETMLEDYFKPELGKARDETYKLKSKLEVNDRKVAERNPNHTVTLEETKNDKKKGFFK